MAEERRKLGTKDRERKLLEKAYDAVYDLNSYTNYKFDDILVRLNKYALRDGYVFKLNKFDHFKCVKKEES